VNEPAGTLLSGKRLLATGVLTESSLASAVVRTARAQGAEVLLTSPLCRGFSVTSRVAPRLGVEADVLELDVTLPDDLAGLEQAVREAGWDRVDGVLHSLAYLPVADRSAGFAAVPWEVVGPSLQTGAWSLAALVHAVRPLLVRGSSIVGLDMDAERAWPGQDWLGVAQAGLEATTRYLAREVGPDGVRVNLVATGPQRTLLAKAVEGRDELVRSWNDRAPLGWDAGDPTAVARAAVMLLSDWFPATTGSIVHVDGGARAVAISSLH
jgi:enoyl-[acyl-carrier protein] reductase I